MDATARRFDLAVNHHYGTSDTVCVRCGDECRVGDDGRCADCVRDAAAADDAPVLPAVARALRLMLLARTARAMAALVAGPDADVSARLVALAERALPAFRRVSGVAVRHAVVATRCAA